MRNLKIKFYRSYEGDIPSYGTRFNHLLDNFVGGPKQWDTSNSHGIASIPSANIRVQRYESGPEIIELALTLAPAYITALTGLMVAWQRSRKKAKDEKRTIKITVGNRSYEGPVKDEEEVQKIISFLSEGSSS